MLLQGLVGLSLFFALALGCSKARGSISWGKIARLGACQLGLLFLFIKVPGASFVFSALGKGVGVLQSATLCGTRFVFGYLGGEISLLRWLRDREFHLYLYSKPYP